MYPIRVELSSHTDSRGTFEYNDWLSQKRAESVVNYLVKHGVNKYRVKAIGYGKRFLLNKCAEGVPCSESEHRVNRRTEVKVISNPDIQKYQIDAIDPNQFKNGEQINQSALPANFFDNYDKFNSDEESISSFENNQGSDLNSKHKFSIQFARGEFIIESRYQYIVDEMINILFKDPTIIIQITAQDDANDHSPILSGRRANSIRDYFISKGISTGRCLINETRKTKSMVSYGRAVISSNNANLEELVLMNLMQSYKGDTKGIIIKNDNGNYCVQIGEFKTRAGSQDLVAKIQSIISARLFVIEENSIFKIRTKSSRNKNDAIEMAAIIQASGILYGE